MSLPLPDLSRKIEGPPLAGYPSSYTHIRTYRVSQFYLQSVLPLPVSALITTSFPSITVPRAYSTKRKGNNEETELKVG